MGRRPPGARARPSDGTPPSVQLARDLCDTTVCAREKSLRTTPAAPTGFAGTHPAFGGGVRTTNLSHTGRAGGQERQAEMLSKMTMGKKILASFAAAVAITLVMGAVSYSGLSRVTGKLDDIASLKFPSLAALSKMNEGHDQMMRGINALFIPRASAEVRAAAFKRVEEGVRKLDEARKTYEGLPHTGETVELYAHTGPAWEAWKAQIHRTLELLRQRDQILSSGHSTESAEVRAI